MTAKSLSFKLLVLGCMAVTVYLFSPGYMNNDAMDQLQQGRSGLYNDWHPPAMSAVWGLLDRFLPGPLGMFLLQTALFWGGLGICIALIHSRSARWNIYLLAGFYPPAFMLLSTVLKDVVMSSALLFGFSLILYAQEKKSSALFIPGIFFITYGMLLRHNAVLAALPLFLYAGIVFADIRARDTDRMPSLRNSIALGAGAFFFALLLGNLWNSQLTRIQSYPFQQVMVHDLAAISLKTRDYILPEYLAASEQPSMKDLRRLYQLRSLENLYWPDFTPIHFKILLDPLQVRDLVQVWTREVLDHPSAYLEHRLSVLAAILNITNTRTCYPYYYEETTYRPRGYFGHGGERDYYSVKRITNQLFTWLESFRDTFLYWNWLYVLLPLILCVLSLWRLLKRRDLDNRPPMIALALSMSALLYSLAYVFVATTCDFRMFHWNVVVTLVASLFLSNQQGGKGATEDQFNIRSIA